jgi:hypothetical protein
MYAGMLFCALHPHLFSLFLSSSLFFSLFSLLHSPLLSNLLPLTQSQTCQDVSSMASEALSLLSLLYPSDAEGSEGPIAEDSVDCTGARASAIDTEGGVDVCKYRSCNPRYITQARALCGAAIKK